MTPDKFEQKYGTMQMVKVILSSLNSLLIERGVLKEGELETEAELLMDECAKQIDSEVKEVADAIDFIIPEDEIERNQ